MVTNPHIKHVYTAYYNAFETLRTWPRVASLEDNHAFASLLRRLVDEHGGGQGNGGYVHAVLAPVPADQIAERAGTATPSNDARPCTDML